MIRSIISCAFPGRRFPTAPNAAPDVAEADATSACPKSLVLTRISFAHDSRNSSASFVEKLGRRRNCGRQVHDARDFSATIRSVARSCDLGLGEVAADRADRSNPPSSVRQSSERRASRRRLVRHEAELHHCRGHVRRLQHLEARLLVRDLEHPGPDALSSLTRLRAKTTPKFLRFPPGQVEENVLHLVGLVAGRCRCRRARRTCSRSWRCPRPSCRRPSRRRCRWSSPRRRRPERVGMDRDEKAWRGGSRANGDAVGERDEAVVGAGEKTS